MTELTLDVSRVTSSTVEGERRKNTGTWAGGLWVSIGKVNECDVKGVDVMRAQKPVPEKQESKARGCDSLVKVTVSVDWSSQIIAQQI